jgi:hypothetical protein
MDASTPRRRRFLMQMAGTAAALALPLQALASNKTKPSDSMQPVPDSPWKLLLIPELTTWLNKHPKVRDALIWEDSNGVAKPYQAWGNGQLQLIKAYKAAYQNLPTGLPEVPANIAPEAVNETVVSKTDAWNLYLTHVAHSLAVELRKDVPWSIVGMPAPQLAILFDSRQFFAWNAEANGYQMDGKFGGGYSTLAPPDLVYNFLQANKIPNALKLAGAQQDPAVVAAAQTRAYAALIEWCGDKLSHFTGWTDKANVTKIWQYSGCPPVARVISGTIDPTFSPKLRHWTGACFGTSAFIRAVCRTMNIAVEVKSLWYTGHMAPYVPALDIWLSHGDDPYSGFCEFSEKAVGADLSYPRSEVLVSGAVAGVWFNPALTDAQRVANVGRRVAELAVAHLPLGILVTYINDQKNSVSHAAGTTYDALKSVYTLAQLDAQNLWQKMDQKIAAHGGGDALLAVYQTALVQQKET